MARVCIAALLLCAACLVVGCGYKTNPRPASATIPGDVGLVEARAFPDRVELRWSVPTTNTDGSPLEDLSGFKVYRFSEKLGEECEDCRAKKEIHANVDYQTPVNAVIEKGDVRYSDRKVQPGNSYHYWVAAYNLRARQGPESYEVTVPFGEPPPPPFRLTAINEVNSIRLEWDIPPRLGGISTYRIYRGQTDNVDAMKPVGRTKWAERYFVDNEIKKGRTYYYSVRSVRVSRGVRIASLPSRTVKAEFKGLPLEPPEKVKITPPTQAGMRIYWDPVKVENVEIRYNVYRSVAGRPFTKINRKPLVSPWYRDTDVVRGEEYAYRVSAFPKDRPHEESSRSPQVSEKYLPVTQE